MEYKNEKYSIFQLCEYGFSDNVVMYMYYNKFTIDKLKHMNVEEFSEYYSVNKKNLYDRIMNTIYTYNLNSEYISIYVLLIENLSMNNIKKCIDLSINLNDLKNLDEKKLINYYGIRPSTAKKIIEANNKFLTNELHLRNYSSDENLKLEVKTFNESHTYQISMEELLEEKKVSHHNKKQVKQLPTLSEYIQSIDDLDKRGMLEKRLQGISLKKIADIYHFSREGIRLIISNLVKDIQLIEDEYKKYFEVYNFNVDTFTKTFDLNKEVFFYLNIKYQKGKKNIEDFLENENIDIKYRMNLEEEIFKNCILDDDEYIEKDSKSILEHIIKKYCKNQIRINEIYDLYNHFIEKYICEDIERFITTERALEGRINNSSFTVASKNKIYRYYNYGEYNFDELVKELYLNQYENKVISSRRLFFDYPTLMQEYDILDEYELHNILKLGCSNDKQINFKRMPTIEVGECDLKKQIFDLIIELSPVNKEDLVSRIEDLYGFRKSTINANMLKDFDCYQHNNIYKIEQEMLNEEQIKILKVCFDKEIYLKEEFKKIFFDTLNVENKKLFNAYNIKSLGFKIYQTFILCDKYLNISDFYRNLLLKDDFLDLNKIDKPIRNNQIFFRILDEYRNNLDLIEVDTDKYITIHKLQKSNVHKNELISYRKSVENILNVHEIVTLKYLNKKGFYHKIYNYGFENIFYESILRGSKYIKYRFSSGVMLFKIGNETIKFSNLCEQFINQRGGMNIYQFKEELFNIYGIDLNINEIKVRLESSNLYYNKIMDKIYKNYEEYFEEIKRG